MSPPGEPTSNPPPAEDSPHSIAPGVTIAPGGLRLQFSRGSGPGGQNVNKLNTKAEAWIVIEQIVGLSFPAKDRLRSLAGRRLTNSDELHLISEMHRTQEGNRREIFSRLRDLIVQARHEPKRRRKTRPTAASKRKRLDSKRRRSEIKAHRTGRE
jgi:ribosome-associated protein